MEGGCVARGGEGGCGRQIREEASAGGVTDLAPRAPAGPPMSGPVQPRSADVWRSAGGRRRREELAAVEPRRLPQSDALSRAGCTYSRAINRR